MLVDDVAFEQWWNEYSPKVPEELRQPIKRYVYASWAAGQNHGCLMVKKIMNSANGGLWPTLEHYLEKMCPKVGSLSWTTTSKELIALLRTLGMEINSGQLQQQLENCQKHNPGFAWYVTITENSYCFTYVSLSSAEEYRQQRYF